MNIYMTVYQFKKTLDHTVNMGILEAKHTLGLFQISSSKICFNRYIFCYANPYTFNGLDEFKRFILLPPLKLTIGINLKKSILLKQLTLY